MTPFEKAIALRRAGVHVPPFPKMANGDPIPVEYWRVHALAFLNHCEEWEAAVEDAYRVWNAREQ